MISDYISSEMLGFNVLERFENGRDALAYTLTHKVDCAITDIKMPYMSGLEFAAKLQEEKNPCKVILLSGYSEFEDARKAIQLGVYDYLLKPLDPALLSEKLFALKMQIDSERKFQEQQREIALLGLEQLLVEWCNEKKSELFLLEKMTQINVIENIQEQRGILIKAHVVSAQYDEEMKENLIRKELDTLCHAAFLLDNIENSYIFCLYHAESGLLSKKRTPSICIESIYEFDGLNDLKSKFAESIHPMNLSTPDDSLCPDVVIETAVRYLNVHYNEKNISRESVASMCFMTPAYFGRYFKQRIGETFIDYLTKIRIKKAMELLRENASLEKIAEKVGYGSVRHFIRVFKTQTGYTPSMYRKEILKQELIS